MTPIHLTGPACITGCGRPIYMESTGLCARCWRLAHLHGTPRDAAADARHPGYRPSDFQEGAVE